MNKYTKTIKNISESDGTTKTGKPYKRWEFEFSDGIRLSTFDEKIGTAFKSGDNVEIETEYKGKFQELKSMVKTDKKPVVSNREQSIIAQALTKAWCSAANRVIETKEVLEAYNYFLKSI